MTSTMITLETVCPFCGQVTEVLVYEDDYYAWCYGEKLIQDAFPYLTANEREMVKTGICGACWDAMFGFPEEEEEDKEECDIDPENYYPEDPSIEEEMGWDDWGYNEDMGYDPYMGCYTDDC